MLPPSRLAVDCQVSSLVELSLRLTRILDLGDHPQPPAMTVPTYSKAGQAGLKELLQQLESDNFGGRGKHEVKRALGFSGAPPGPGNVGQQPTDFAGIP